MRLMDPAPCLIAFLGFVLLAGITAQAGYFAVTVAAVICALVCGVVGIENS